MTTLAYLIPVALFLGALGLSGFLWALRSGQYDDLDGAAERILIDRDRILLVPSDSDQRAAGRDVLSSSRKIRRVRMQAESIMTKPVITTHANATIAEAVELMLSKKVSCLPVANSDGTLIGIVSKSDFLRREELGTQRVRPRWLELDLGPGTTANDYARSNGRIIHQVMTTPVISAPPGAPIADIVDLMMQHRINNVPIVDRDRVVGIITRTDLLLVLIRAMPKQGTTPPDDDLIRKAILAELQSQTWSGGDLIDVRVSDGLVELKGAIVDERQRKAAIVAAEKVAGVGQVKDSLLLSRDPFGDGFIAAEKAGTPSRVPLVLLPSHITWT